MADRKCKICGKEIARGLICWECVRKHQEAKKNRETVTEFGEYVCDNICRWRVRAFEQNKDPDDAERWLDRNYCSAGCPVMRLL